MTHRPFYRLIFLALVVFLPEVHAEVENTTNIPKTLNYQGRVLQNGTPFDGTGHFVFALFDGNDSVIWNNWQGRVPTVTVDPGGSGSDTPKKIAAAADPLPVEVRNGLFSLDLGSGGTVSNNTPIDTEVFFDATSNTQRARSGMKLAVWFSSAAAGPFARLDPDIQFACVPYAMVAGVAETVKNGAVGTAQLASGAVTQAKLSASAAANNLGQSGGLIASPDKSSTELLAAGFKRTSRMKTEGLWRTAPGQITDTPTARSGHSAIWTGTEMIVWGGSISGGLPFTGGRFNPATQTWLATNNNGAPELSDTHAAVWTGTEMIIWGRSTADIYAAVGRRYNPVTDRWQTMNMNGAPAGRSGATVIWTGTEMIVWGGQEGPYIYNQFVNTGVRYNPTTDTWTAISTVSAPNARVSQTAIWTGTEMIVWGGYNGTSYVNTGARYNPATNAWSALPTASAPVARSSHTAIWTGTEMMVWGGYSETSYFNTGARYNPATNAWTALPTASAPDARESHTAIWTGTEMIVWGGGDGGGGQVNTGSRYNSITNTWQALSNLSAPRPVQFHTAIWTGDKMLVWGGDNYSDNVQGINDGGSYTPSTATWDSIIRSGPPEARYGHTGVWTGNHLLVWGGRNSNSDRINTGGKFDPETNGWSNISRQGSPSARDNHGAVWASSEMIIWGGWDGASYVGSGARYNPATNVWTLISAAGAPPGRSSPLMVWTGTEMIVWGGSNSSGILTSGARYQPVTDIWLPMSAVGAPQITDGAMATVVWTGSEMIVWSQYAKGGRYNPNSNTWRPMNESGGPSLDYKYTATWTGEEMLVWGGETDSPLQGGARYNPTTDSWVQLSGTALGTSQGIYGHSAVWTGTTLITWGGETGNDGGNGTYQGGQYQAIEDLWNYTESYGAPSSRYDHIAVWTGHEMLVFGGRGSFAASTSSLLHAYSPSRFIYLYAKP